MIVDNDRRFVKVWKALRLRVSNPKLFNVKPYGCPARNGLEVTGPFICDAV